LVERECIEHVMLMLPRQARTRFANGNHDMTRCIGADMTANSRGCGESAAIASIVDDQVQANLLYLDAVGRNGRQGLGEVHLYDDAVPLRLGAYQTGISDRAQTDMRFLH
jgi:hypothetical protein